MNAHHIQKKLEALHYWDARILQLNAEYFGDEVTLIFDDDEGHVKLVFCGCSKVCFITHPDDRIVPTKKLTAGQIPYFIQDIIITDCLQEGFNLLNCRIIAPPITIEISCTSITVSN